MAGERNRHAGAFAPCHVTGIVIPGPFSRDPRERGSRGAGLVLSLGVRAIARWEPSPRSTVRVRGPDGTRLPISEEVARRLVRRRAGRWSVELDHDLPIGQGFGTSAAGALATGLAVGRLVGAPRRTVVEVAHLADLFGGGGLGGVAAILGGGLEARVVPGLPPHGEIRRTAHPAPVLVGVLGPPIWSRSVLTDPSVLDRLRRAGPLFGQLTRSLTPTRFWDVAEEFTGRAGLCPSGLERLLRTVRRHGGRAAQAMFGSGFVVTARSPSDLRTLRDRLDRLGVSVQEASVATRGARLFRAVPVARRNPSDPAHRLRRRTLPDASVLNRGPPAADP